MKNKDTISDLAQKIKDLLSEQLGVDAEEISEDDSLAEDLNMRAVDISDFLERLKSLDIDIDSQELEDIDTVGDLIELAGSEGHIL